METLDEERNRSRNMTKAQGFLIVCLLAVIAVFLFGMASAGISREQKNKMDDAVNGTAGGVASWQAKLPDGRYVTCVSWKNGPSGSISCDWGNAK